jgi:hypothetical protein
MALPSRQHIVKTTYLFVRGYLILLGGYLTIAHIQLPSESANSRKLSFRYVRFSETELPIFSVLGNSEGIKRAGASTPRLSATLLVVGWLISPLGYYLDTHGVGTLVLFRYLGR